MVLLNQIFKKYYRIVSAKGLRLTPNQFKRCLFSAEYARQRFPGLNQTVWVSLIDLLICEVDKHCSNMLTSKLVNRLNRRGN